MRQKLMLLATGVFAALALTALPAVASAGEPIADCENGAASCAGSVAGGAVQMKSDAGEGITCSAVHGTAGLTSTTSTGTMELTYTGCVETVTGFKLSCSNTGFAGKITTGAMVTHLIYLDHAPSKTTGLKITLPGYGTGLGGVTFNCAGFARKTITGSLIGHISNPECGTYRASHTADFTESATGVQRWMQATTTGPTTDLIQSNDAGGAYTTMAMTGSTTITWTGSKVKITC